MRSIKEIKKLTAISVINGVITLIDENGMIRQYRQRGISKLPITLFMSLVNNGILHEDCLNFNELPSNYSISFEDERIMGKAKANFNIKT